METRKEPVENTRRITDWTNTELLAISRPILIMTHARLSSRVTLSGLYSVWTSGTDFGSISRDVLSILRAREHPSVVVFSLSSLCNVAPRHSAWLTDSQTYSRASPRVSHLRANEAAFRRDLGIARISNTQRVSRITSESRIYRNANNCAPFNGRVYMFSGWMKHFS